MPRRQKLTRRNLEFEIHEDPPAAGMDSDTDTRDFAHESSIPEPETPIETPSSEVQNIATDSNMTKASTLVNEDVATPGDELRKSLGDGEGGEAGDKGGLEERLDNMLEELKGEVRGAERLVEKSIEHEDHPDVGEEEDTRRASVDSWDVGDDAAQSRLSIGSQDAHTEESASRRESTLSAATHDNHTEGTFSRRESALSDASWQSDRRRTSIDEETADDSMLSHEPASTHDESFEEDHSLVDGSVHDPSALDEGSHASTYEDNERSLLEDECTEDTASRRESIASQEQPNRRASERTEALIKAAAQGIVDQINRSAQSSRTGNRADEGTAQSSARLSGAEPPVMEDKSARSSEAHESVTVEEETESAVPETQSSEVPEAALDPSGSRSSEAHQTVAVDDETEPQTADDQPPETDEPAVVLEEDIGSKPASARHSEVHEPHSKQTSARPSLSHESENEGSVIQSIEQDEPIHHSEEEAGTSSHNENDDDVFSDHSPRSSVGSLSGEDHAHRKLSDNITQRTSIRSAPRVSDFSHYDTDDQEEQFVPTVRGTPRPPFRSPSSVKAMQMSSPPASVIGSSRSSRRTPLPTVSRLGSPSAQYSPKKTPPRFKRNTPPLVLLHVTLLPLRWPWGDVLDVAQTDELSESGRGLKEAWRQLQERMGDTTCERGILLPHPQNDFEILEERLLEALELPLRRRARILECGHYLGPSNDLTLLSDSDSEDEDYYPSSPRRSQSLAHKDTHWCSTCHSEIRYDSLGLGKVFRVKVYASNGLIKAGAWEACWKEMERVDVEIEPIVETETHEELVRLDNEQQKAMELHQEEAEREEYDRQQQYPEEEFAVEDEPTQVHGDAPPSSPPEIRVTSESASSAADEERRLRDEARLREIYGDTPAAASEPTAAEQQPSPEYVYQKSPPSPSAEAHARREERRQSGVRNDSLPELILEAVKLALQDRKNVVIALMSVLVLALAMRSATGPQSAHEYQPIVREQPSRVTVTERFPEATQSIADVVMQSIVSSSTPVAEDVHSPSGSVDPCSTASSQVYQQAIAEQETVVSEKIVTVVETLTETSYETATVTQAVAPQETVPEEAAGEDEQTTPVGEDLLGSAGAVIEDAEPTMAAVEEDEGQEEL